MKITYISLYEATDIHKWSGCGYYISKALENENAELQYIGDIKIPIRKINRLKKLSYRFLHQKYNYTRTLAFAKQFAEIATPRINPKTDIIFSPGTIAISQLNTKIPKVFYTDATFASIINFYESYTKLTQEILQQGNIVEQTALDSCSMAIYTSEWAAESAIKNYNIKPEKVKIVPFGANIDTTLSFGEIESIVSNRSKNECNLLFIGVDWKRKGGDLAVKVAEELNKAGLKTKLHVVGIPQKLNLPDFVIEHGFISKSTPEGKAKLNRLFAESHFLIVPSIAEAFGLVFCEASSFGVPSLSTNVGGIPSVIRNGLNGQMFPLEKTEKDYASFILNHFHNFHSYKQLALSSFNEYEQRLNWKVSGKALINLLKSI